MNKSSFKKNHEAFDTSMNIYRDMLNRFLCTPSIIRTRQEKHEIVEAFVLRCSVRWELLMTWDILTSLNRDSSQYATALGLKLRQHLPYDECKAILYGPRFLDFKGTQDVLSFSRKYLVPALNPFPAIGSYKRKIDEFLLIRNLLAHQSDVSLRSYRKLLTDVYEYKRVPEPGTFLTAINALGRYTWEGYFAIFLKVSQDMLASVV
jgi:hypothetical protein